MDEITRRTITRILVIAAVVCLFIYGVHQSGLVREAAQKLAKGTLPEKVAAIEPLVSRGEVATMLDGQPRWVQVGAVEALLALGTPQALQQLVEATPKLDDPVAKWAAQGLAGMGRLAIGPLVECIQNKDATVRSTAEAPLAAIGGPEVVVAMRPLMGQYDDFVRVSVTKIFAKLPDLAAPLAVQTVLRETPLPDQTSAAFARSQNCALDILAAIGKPAVGSVVTKLLPSSRERVRANSALVLGRMVAGLKQEDVLVVQPLLTLAEDPAWSVRRRAAWALGELSKDGRRPEVLASLERHLNDTPEVRAQAIKSLGEIGAPESAAALVSVIINSREGVSAELVAAFQALGPAALPALNTALAAPEAGARELATQAVAAIGTPAAAPILAARLADPDVAIRRVAAQALETQATPDTVPSLARALEDPDPRVYTSVQRGLEAVGVPAVSALIGKLGGSSRTAVLAEQALAVIGAPAVPELVAVLRSGNEVTRPWAAFALGDIGAEAVAPASALAGDTGAPAPSRAAAAEALGLTKLAAALPALKPLTSAADPSLRAAAIRALATSQQEEATTYLVQGLKDPSPEVRSVALSAVRDWQGTGVDEQLSSLLTAGSVETKRLAAVALAFHASPERLPGMMMGTPALASSTTNEVGGMLNQIVADPAVPEAVRRQAVEGLGYAGNGDSIAILVDLLTPGNPVGATAARALGLVGERLAAAGDNQRALETATQLLTVVQTTPDDSLRLQCAAALSVVGAPAISQLVSALKTAPAGQAPWLAAVLGAIGKPAVIAAMREASLRQADAEWAEVALSLTGALDAQRFLGRLRPEEQLSKESLAAGEALYEQIMAARHE